MTGAALRVLFDHEVTASQRYGGVSRYVLSLVRALAAVPEVDVRLFAPAHITRYIRTGDPLHPWSFALAPWRRGMRWRAPLLEPLFRAAVAFERPNVIHETAFMPRRRAGAALARRPAVVTTLHDMIPERFPQYIVQADRVIAAKRAALQRADAIVCISESTRRDLLQLYPEHAPKTHVVWHGVDHVPAAGSTPPSLLNEPYLLYVGTRGGYKNFRGLLQAYASAGELWRACRLLCFGGGPLSAEETAACHAAGLPAGRVVQLEGNDELLAVAYRHARLFVFPSRYEGFGMPLTEAMVQGCPIACSRASSFPEVAADAAAYFDADDPADIARALQMLALDDSCNREMAERSAQRAGVFTWAECARRTLAVYRRVVA